MSTLKIWLPNFKFGSGAQLGDELRVIDCGDVHGNDNVYNVLKLQPMCFYIIQMG